MLSRGFPSLFGRDPFGDMFGDDFFDDPFFSGGRRGRGHGPMGHGEFGGVMNNMMTAPHGGSMVVMSTSFSTNGREVQSSTTSARMGPGGVSEIQSQSRDGRTGKEKIVLERRLGERARRVEKSRDMRTGDEETVDNTYGIQDGYEDHFDQEWQQAAASRLAPPPRVTSQHRRLHDARAYGGQRDDRIDRGRPLLMDAENSRAHPSGRRGR